MTAYNPDSFRILCIEDEPEILADIADELRDHGFAVDEARSAEAALPMVETCAPDLIVCDMQMPGMNGRDLLELLRGRTDALGEVPFVFLTAFGDRKTMLDGRRAGADDYLVKPIDYDLLIATVETHLVNARRRAERIPAAVAAVQPAPASPGRAALLARIEGKGEGTIVAIAAIDNPTELTRRLGDRESGHFRALVRRIERMAGAEIFVLSAFKFAIVCENTARNRALLARLCRFGVRDKGGVRQPLVFVTTSVVIGHVAHHEAPVRLVERLSESARLVQREGGARVVELNDADLSEMRLASAIRSELVSAIRQGQLHVCFQPKVKAADGEPVAAEVLVRWTSPALGQLSPSTFIPVVERAGLLSHVTDWVLRQAALHQLELKALGLIARLAVNIGASEFTAALPARIAAICAEVGADPQLIEVEITETTLMTDLDGANAVANALHHHGMVVALDDFGTGFSSLSYLRQCDVDAIKIDRSFVERIGKRESDRKIIEGVIGLAKSLGLETIAEGVETEEQRLWLAAHGCDLLQGFLIARPLRFDGYCALLRRWEPAA